MNSLFASASLANQAASTASASSATIQSLKRRDTVNKPKYFFMYIPVIYIKLK